MDAQKGRIVQTLLATGILLLAFFAQGAAAAVGGLTGARSAVVRGLILWGLVGLTAAFCRLRHKGLSSLGFRRTDCPVWKQPDWLIPLLAVALMPLSCGVNMAGGLGLVLANLFLTLGIGFCEEIYFRGIVCRLWLEKGERTAAAVSAGLFAVCHLMNLAGGAGIAETVLQICFALVYGVVFAQIFMVCRSIWPCIFLHAFHDFCSLLSAEGSRPEATVLGGLQFVILLCCAVILVKRRKAAAPRQG